MYPHIRSVRYHSATQTGYSAQAQHNSVAQLVSLEFTDSTCECRRLVQFIFVGAVYHNALTICAALLCRALRRVNRLCSRTVSGTANRLRKTRKKKSSAVPLFAAVTCRQSAPDYPRERGDSQEGGNRRCLPSCAPARRQRKSPAAGAANPRAPQSATPS